MSLLTNVTLAWAGPIVLADDEVWQARSGSCYLSTDNTPDADDGVLLEQGQALFLSAGVQIQYRSKGELGATIARTKV